MRSPNHWRSHLAEPAQNTLLPRPRSPCLLRRTVCSQKRWELRRRSNRRHASQRRLASIAKKARLTRPSADPTPTTWLAGDTMPSCLANTFAAILFLGILAGPASSTTTFTTFTTTGSFVDLFGTDDGCNSYPAPFCPDPYQVFMSHTRFEAFDFLDSPPYYHRLNCFTETYCE